MDVVEVEVCGVVAVVVAVVVVDVVVVHVGHVGVAEQSSLLQGAADGREVLVWLVWRVAWVVML